MSRREGVQLWADDEFGFLADHEDWTAKAVAEALGRTRGSVEHKRSQLRNGWSPQIQDWTPEEDEFLLATPHFTRWQVADKLPGRTPNAVMGRRSHLAQKHGVRFGTSNKDPNTVGSRTLLAKTCPDCGLLLQARWFTFRRARGGKWNTKCVRCEPRGSWRPSATKQAENDRTNKRFAAAMHAITRPRAERHGEPWMEADDQTLQDPDLTLLEKALRLERTYGATATRCKAMGYSSKKGLGDPKHGHWIIRLPEQVPA